MKHCLKFLPALALLLTGPAVAADAPAAADKPVSMSENSAFYLLTNGIVTAVIAKNSGDLVSLKYKDQEMLATTHGADGQIDVSRDLPGDPGRGGFIGTDHMYGFWSHDAVAPRLEDKITIDPKTNGGARAEVSVKGYSDGANLGHGPGAPQGGAFAADIEIRYALGRGDSGIYTYCTFDHLPAYPDATMNEARFCVKLSNDFDWMLVDDLRHFAYPPEKERDGDDKYNYTTDQFDHPFFGWANSARQIGCFFVNPTTEYLSGGPTKVEFVCHRDTTGPFYYPCILNYWRSSHYGGSSVDVAAGEHWTKTIGPFLIYCNSGADPVGLWKDAQTQQAREAAKWPYDWATGTDYPHKDGRSTVSGQLVLTDPLMPGAKMSNVRVGLTHPDYHIPTSRTVSGNNPVDIDWMTDAKYYEYWTRGSNDGTFTVANIRPGTYTLHAIADGVLGEFAQTNITVEAGKPLDLGKLTWTPVRRGQQVWDIGIPNRNSSEFAKGDDFFHDGMALVYRDLFPNDVHYVIGKSDFHKDWYFEHVPHVEDANARPNSIAGGGASAGRANPWTISWDMASAPKGVATLRVAIAGGSVTGGRIPVQVNGQDVAPIRVTGDSTVGRNGIQGLWYQREIPFPASLLKAGTNTITLTVPAGGQTNGVVYDYLRLELDENAPPPSPAGL